MSNNLNLPGDMIAEILFRLPPNHLLRCSIKVLGSCNGLVCICNVVDDMALWNPCTRMHHVLPYLSIELKRYFGTCSCRVCVFGFGYDVVSDDYKVVRIAQFGVANKRSFECEVKVYSFRRNSWRRIRDLPYFVIYPGANGVFAGGALHWLVSRTPESNEANVIVGLDLEGEDYKEVEQPEIPGKNFNMEIGVLESRLCFIANFQCKNVDLWVMKEYGVKESWTKLFSIVQQEGAGIIRSLKPLAYSKSGNEVLIEHDNVNLFWYDLRRKEVKNVWIPGMPITFEAEIYVGSLMLLDANRLFYERAQHDRAEANNILRRDDFLSEGFRLSL
ncbi:F-box protein CPR1 [Euphorbia peplus]|nr:F-box protein CPR1 [Euphorbia peplus]